MLFINCFTWQSLLLQLTHDDAMQQLILKPKWSKLARIKHLLFIYSGRGFLIFPCLKVGGQTYCIYLLWSVFHPVPDQQYPQLINGLYGVCFKQRNCSDCSTMSLIWNAERNSWAILRPQSWLCDGVDVKCSAGCSQMQQYQSASLSSVFSAMNRLDRLKILCSQKLLQNHYQWSFYLNEIFDAKWCIIVGEW